MKKGDFVDIYRSPYKSKDFEGRAELIKSIKQTPYLKGLGFQIWRVRFLDKKETVERIVKL